jgi:Tol biopolymer transport system component
VIDERELLERAARQFSPDVGIVERVYRRRDRKRRNRRIGTAALALILAAVAAGGLVRTFGSTGTQPANNHTASTCYGQSTTHCPYFLDLRTGERSQATGSLVSKDLVNPWYVFSPDGERVAYNICSEGPCGRRDKILVADADGTKAVTLLSSGGHGIVWSPDGTKLLYLAAGNPPLLYVHDFATGRTTRLLDPTSARWIRFGNPNVDIGPNDADFSPDGRTVIFCRPRTPSANATWDAWAVPVTGGTPTLVLRNAQWAGYLADGKRIAFVPSKAERISIASPGGLRRTLVKTPGHSWPMSISPDRTKIVYESASGTHVVDVATGEASLVAADGQLAWWAGNDTLFVEVGLP